MIFFLIYKAKKISQFLSKKSTILDIGCGDGTILNFYKETHDVYGTEINIEQKNPFIITSNKKIFHHLKKINLVIFSHVLPHFYESIKLLKKIIRKINSKDLIYISMPNINSLQYKLFKNNWLHLDLPRHLYHFHNIKFDHFMKKNKFIKKINLKTEHHQIFFGWYQSFLNLFLKKNILYESISIQDKKLSIFEYFAISALSIIFIPLSLILTFLEFLNLIKCSIIDNLYIKK